MYVNKIQLKEHSPNRLTQQWEDKAGLGLFRRSDPLSGIALSHTPARRLIRPAHDANVPNAKDLKLGTYSTLSKRKQAPVLAMPLLIIAT